MAAEAQEITPEVKVGEKRYLITDASTLLSETNFPQKHTAALQERLGITTIAQLREYDWQLSCCSPFDGKSDCCDTQVVLPPLMQGKMAAFEFFPRDGAVSELSERGLPQKQKQKRERKRQNFSFSSSDSEGCCGGGEAAKITREHVRVYNSTLNIPHFASIGTAFAADDESESGVRAVSREIPPPRKAKFALHFEYYDIYREDEGGERNERGEGGGDMGKQFVDASLTRIKVGKGEDTSKVQQVAYSVRRDWLRGQKVLPNKKFPVANDNDGSIEKLINIAEINATVPIALQRTDASGNLVGEKLYIADLHTNSLLRREKDNADGGNYVAVKLANNLVAVSMVPTENSLGVEQINTIILYGANPSQEAYIVHLAVWMIELNESARAFFREDQKMTRMSLSSVLHTAIETPMVNTNATAQNGVVLTASSTFATTPVLSAPAPTLAPKGREITLSNQYTATQIAVENDMWPRYTVENSVTLRDSVRLVMQPSIQFSPGTNFSDAIDDRVVLELAGGTVRIEYARESNQNHEGTFKLCHAQFEASTIVDSQSAMLWWLHTYDGVPREAAEPYMALAQLFGDTDITILHYTEY